MSPLTDLTRNRQRHTFALRTLCLTLCAAVLLSVCPNAFFCAPAACAESTVSDLTAQKEALAQEQELLSQQRDEAADSLEEQKAQNEIIRKQIDAKSQEIKLNQQLLTSLEKEIDTKTANIAEQDSAIAKLDSEIALQQQRLRVQLRSISQRNGVLSFIQLILNSETYADYLIGFKISEQLSKRSERLMQQIETNLQTAQDARNKLKTDKAALEIEHTQVAAVQTELESGKASLQQLYAEANAMTERMFADVEYLNEQIAAAEAEQAALQNSIDYVMEQIRQEEEEKRRQEEEERRQQEEEEARREEEEAENGESDSEESDEEESDYEDDSDYEEDDTTDDGSSDDDYDDDSDYGDGDDADYDDDSAVEQMLWPAPTCRVITSSFKYREQFGRWHNGLDIACYGDAEGEPIVAAASGKVRYANDYDTWGGGYGLYMMIDHGYDSEGRRIITVYAHCSEILVYEGMEVEAGETIGYVGDTGNSYGAHLHFEVQVDGVAVDPVSNGYLSTEWVDILG